MSNPTNPLQPLSDALKQLWAEHLSVPFDRRTAPTVDEVEAIQAVYTKGMHATLAFNSPPFEDDPRDPDALQHRIRTRWMLLYRFFWDWHFGYVAVDAEEYRRRKNDFNELYDFVGSVRFGLSGGRHGGTGGLAGDREWMPPWEQAESLDLGPDVPKLRKLQVAQSVRDFAKRKGLTLRTHATGSATLVARADWPAVVAAWKEERAKKPRRKRPSPKPEQKPLRWVCPGCANEVFQDKRPAKCVKCSAGRMVDGRALRAK